MSETGLTTIQLKKINKSKVYHYIYQQHTTSKLQIVQELQMGLSTVSQNLTLLEQDGYIQRNGYFDSTGGRKAQTIQIVPDFRISIGIGILKEMFHMTAIDLYGHILDMETISLSYADTDAYYKQMTEKIQAFITSHHYDPQKILGISIATQGITSSDHTTVTYGKILHNTGMNVDHFSSRLPFACHLEHDSKSAAHLELWNHPELDSAIVILLNRNLGGAIITDRHIHQGSTMHSGAVLCGDISKYTMTTTISFFSLSDSRPPHVASLSAGSVRPCQSERPSLCPRHNAVTSDHRILRRIPDVLQGLRNCTIP